MNEQIQYIGARYVIKIYENKSDPSTAEWDANVNYEPLVLVTYNYGSYISKKVVPASIGNPADNPTYWVQTGFYNGQMVELQEHVRALESALTTESSTRANADSNILQQLNAFKTSTNVTISQLQLKDNDLTAVINDEIANRRSADTALQGNIQNVSSTLTTALNNEINARTNADTAISTRIDNIVAPSGEAPNPTEIVDARIGANGVTYATLGTAIRSQFTETNGILHESELRLLGSTAYPFISGGYINTSGESVDITDITASAGWQYCIVDCTAGDKFTIRANGGANARCWCFIDASGNSISASDADFVTFRMILTAPTNAVKLIVQNRTNNVNHYVVKGELLKEYTIDKNSTALEEVNNEYLWESGGIVVAYGINAENTHRIRTKGYLPKDATFISCDDLRFIIYAYETDGTYVGVLSNGSFNKENADVMWSCDIRDINYKYNLRVMAVPYTDVEIDTSVSSVFKIYRETEGFYDSGIWEVGGIVSASGDDADNTTRMRTKGFITTKQLCKIVPSDDVSYILYVYDEDGVYQGSMQSDGSLAKSAGSWITSTLKAFNFSTNYKIRLLGKLNNDDNVETEDFDKIRVYLSSTSILSAKNIPASIEAIREATSGIAVGATSNVKMIAHRGDRSYPDSTSLAYIKAREEGFYYLEGDIQRTSDGKYVISHDDNILTRTGVNANISQMTLAQLKEIDFGGYTHPQYSGLAILTLEEFLNLCNELGCTPVLDFKTKTSEQVAEIFDIIDKYGVEVYNVNGSVDTIKAILALKPNQFVRRSFDAYSTSAQNEINSILADYPNAHFMVAYYANSPTFTDAVINSFLALGLEVCPYEINTASQYELYMSGKYYIHNVMVGFGFNVNKYSLLRDNNIYVES